MEETFVSVKRGMKSSLIESLTQKGKDFIAIKLQITKAQKRKKYSPMIY